MKITVVKFLFEFFAGCGAVSSEARRQGFSTKEWELLRGPEGDLTNPVVLRPVQQLIRQRKALAAFLAPPCGSFSLINRSVKRSLNDPWGLKPQESDRARASVTLGNQCMKSAITIIRWLESERRCHGYLNTRAQVEHG